MIYELTTQQRSQTHDTMQAGGVETHSRRISQSEAKRIYCLTQKDIDNIRLASPVNGSGALIGTTDSSSSLDDVVVREYALRKHGGTQQGIELALVERQAGKLQRAAIMRTNMLVRKSRAVQVNRCEISVKYAA